MSHFNGSFPSKIEALDYSIADLRLPVEALPICDCQLRPCRFAIANCDCQLDQSAISDLDQNRQSAIDNWQFSGLSVVLLQLAIERFAADAERAGGVRFVALGVVERGFNGEAFDLFHRR